jgi:hypothetical protein
MAEREPIIGPGGVTRRYGALGTPSIPLRVVDGRRLEK